MLFVEFRFFLFFLAVFAVYWSLRENRHRRIFLLICGYLFYAAWNWKYPEFYDTKVRIDDAHLTREGAEQLTRLLAQEFVQHVRQP